jgi:hypothetical protein
MSFARQRSGRSECLDRRRVFEPEVLERRQLLATGLARGVLNYQSPWLPSDQLVTNPITHQRELFNGANLVNPNNPNSPGFNNAGKVVSGIDRAGDKWIITVHGPGKVIVTDTSPNDGALDDDINTIQLINTSPRTTYVTGNVIPSNTELTSGTILFNQLVAVSGVKSIELNGFNLSSAVTPPVTTTPGIFLYGGVGVLSFNSIDATIDTSVNPTPFQVVIGQPNTPLKVQPSVFVNNITNFVFNSTATTIPTQPLTTPTVQFIINGVIRSFDIVSATQGTIPAAFQFEFPVVGTTGRTAVQGTAVNNLHVAGTARNFTVSRAAVPFSSASSGVGYLNNATFGGNADAVGLDVKGKIGKLVFRRGLGDPKGVFTAVGSNGLLQPETTYGTPLGSTGYPAAGFSGGTIRAASIKKLTVRPANVLPVTAQNPLYVQLQEQGYPTYAVYPGYSLTNAVITTTGSIQEVDILGTQLNTEIKTGFDYSAFQQGLQGTRGASHIARLEAHGDLVNSVASASFIPANNHYAHGTGTAGAGQITERVIGGRFDTGGKTGLNNTGVGLFARKVRLLRLSR